MHGRICMRIEQEYMKISIKRKVDSMSYNLGRNDIFWRIGHEETSDLLANIRALKEIEFSDDTGLTYLHVAACNHKLKVIKLLLEKGANPNCEDNRGGSPILMALGRINENNPEILRVFLEYGLNLERIENGMTIKETILSFEDSELNEVIKEFENREQTK